MLRERSRNRALKPEISREGQGHGCTFFPGAFGEKGSGNGSVAASALEPSNYLGDIAISPTIARANARRHGRDLDDELRILMLHGVLHLLGYDHETDRGEMDRVEARVRRRLGLV